MTAHPLSGDRVIVGGGPNQTPLSVSQNYSQPSFLPTLGSSSLS